MPSQYQDLPWSQRVNKLGDQAEGVFESAYGEGWERYGLNRPRFRLSDVPAFARHTPDYITRKGWVEVQGFGRDQIAKFKPDKLAALEVWDTLWRVDFFLWDSHKKRYGWLRFHDLDDYLGRSDSAAVLLAYNEGNKYWAIPADEVPVVSWIAHGLPLGVSR